MSGPIGTSKGRQELQDNFIFADSFVGDNRANRVGDRGKIIRLKRDRAAENRGCLERGATDN